MPGEDARTLEFVCLEIRGWGYSSEEGRRPFLWLDRDRNRIGRHIEEARLISEQFRRNLHGPGGRQADLGEHFKEHISDPRS